MMCLNKKELMEEKTEHTCFRVSNKSNTCSMKIGSLVAGVFLAAFWPIVLTSGKIIPIIFFVSLSYFWLKGFLSNILFPKTHELYVDDRELVWRTRRKSRDAKGMPSFRLRYRGKIGLSEIDYIMVGGETGAYRVYLKNGVIVLIPECFGDGSDGFFECLRRIAPHIELDPKVIREKWLRERKNKWKRVFRRK